VIRNKSVWRLLGLGLALLGTPALAQDAADSGPTASQPTTSQPTGTIIVPDHFLRRWDPVTLFFDKDQGAVPGAPDDAPEKLVTMRPAQPGAWTWIDGRTLQFRPAIPWPPLSQFDWTIKNDTGTQSVELSRLLDPTVRSDPANGAAGLEQMRSLTLVFSEPLHVKTLAGMLDIAISPLPGLDPAQAQHLTPSDFDIKAMERTSPNDPGTYVVEFHRPIADGMHVAVSIGLSAVPGLRGTVEELDFATATAFSPTLMGCAGQSLPLNARGTIYDKTSALNCTPPDHSAQQDQASSDNDSSDNADNGDGSQDQTGQQAATTPDLTAPATGSLADMPVTTAKTPSTGTPDQSPAPAPAQPSTPRQLVIEFSANPAAIDPIAARNFIRITPSVGNVQTSVVSNRLLLTADFKTATLYHVTLDPTPMTDTAGRALVMNGSSSIWLYWPPEQNFLALGTGNGVVERYGPQMIPLSGRGETQADVRIFPINPMDRSFWPFPATPLATNDNDRPPAPGEQAGPWQGSGDIDTPGLQSHIAALGSPSISTLTQLPLTPLGPSAEFGLDVRDSLARISGRNNPGAYLVGVRALDQPGNRAWIRLQVTDLSVTTVEEEAGLRFVVTSLRSAAPIAGATVEIDGVVDSNWVTLGSGATDADGAYSWPIGNTALQNRPVRIVVSKADDTLVIDPTQPPDRYTANGWAAGDTGWLGWTTSDLGTRHAAAQTLCHMFTERPIYRPTDPVHFKAYIRTLADGLLSSEPQKQNVELVVTAPDGTTSWRHKVAPDGSGNLHYLFADKTIQTGSYTGELDINSTACATVNFTKDAYRLPRFQVRLNGPAEIALDKPATIGMTATYYAGGPASARPVRWRVTEFPYAFAPQPRPGFIYATASLYQPDFGEQSTAAIDSEATTDKEGRASLTLDPTQEASNAPRRYVVEATVTGDDGKTVTNTQDVRALPSFVLAMQAPRYLPAANAIPLQVLMVDDDGKPLSGRSITLTLLRRQWSSILQASDFSNGHTKYQTVVVDEKLIERTLTSGADALKLSLPIDRAGVYIVRLQAADALGRLQTVSVDLFAAGSNPVSWSRPPATVFKVTTDKPAYAPGDNAKLILESPFQTARALAIAELPNGKNLYRWVDVRNGYGVFDLPIDKSFMPRIPVHFVLMRGRIPGGGSAGPSLDLWRPETIAATAWVGVTPIKNIVTVKVTAPDGALPGATVNLTVSLTDDTGKPVSGEVTLWLIDQAVLALAPEAPLNPLPDFIRDPGSRVAVSDTRNWPFGLLPLDENPGGDSGAAGDESLLNKVTIRKNFNPMPYYNPALEVGPSGTVTVPVKLPDDLTIFKIRAVAVSGAERFGFAKGQIAVRLPVIVEPNLPRFVRPGDRFMLAGIGRIVTGPGGAGQAQLAVSGLNVTGPLVDSFTWSQGVPQTFAFPATVPSPGYTRQGDLERTSVKITMAVERNGDKATDAFSVDLPIEPDRDPVHQRLLVDLTSGKPLNLPALAGAARPGTIRRQILIASQPELVRLFAALDYLRGYPFGCTEQRIALARSEVAAKQFSAALDGDDDGRTDHDVNQTLNWITQATDASGFVGFWPGAPGEVTLTAWALEFMVEAPQAGYTVDPVETATLVHALQKSLRSDFQNFVSGGAYVERAWALAALSYAGKLDRDYADELARQRDQPSLEGIAQVSIALQKGGAANSPLLQPLTDALWTGLVIKQRDGKPVYAGLQDSAEASTDYPDIVPSETRTLAEMLRATATTNDPRRKLIVDALATLGKSDGWGSTNANAEAFLALTAYLKSNTGTKPQAVTLTWPNSTQTIGLSSTTPLRRVIQTRPDALTVTASEANVQDPVSIQDDLTWLPVGDGSQVAPVTHGFVVTQESDLVNLAGGPMTRTRLDHAAMALSYKQGDVIEDHIQVVNPENRNYVAITVPLAAGMEPLDPALATAPPDATASSPPTLAPSYVAFMDDRVSYYYNALPQGTYDFYFRTQAMVPGTFIQPAAQAVMMYNDSVHGGSAGATVVIAAPPAKN
jgi:uncharacterized protein YfaS (alpha-2-macroglobulin family)